ncbi:hypothetical protein ACHQM5_002991 [Ranunculus cassubicifolius]
MHLGDGRMSCLHDSLLIHILSFLPTNRSAATSILSRRWRYLWVYVLGDDKVSKLPSSVLHYILSLLPTKHVFATSILSTRWRYLWASVSRIDFKYEREFDPPSPEVVTRFMNSVDSVLNRHNLTKLQKFSLECDTDCDVSRVNAWISTVICHKVQEVDLAIYMKPPSVLPACLFTCESLKVLILLKDGPLKLPSIMSFPNLKSLHLSFLTFSDEYLTKKLFSSCPVLKELIIMTCSWINLTKFSISNHTLKYLVIDKEQELTDGLHRCVINIDAPNLISFVWRSEYLPEEFIISDSRSLVSANIIIDRCAQKVTREKASNCMSKLLGLLKDVKILKLSSKVFKILSDAEDISNSLPTFNNLIHLKISTIFRLLARRSLLHLLKISPNLETIVFADGCKPYADNEEEWRLDAVPQDFLLHLKKVKLGMFFSEPMEFNAAKFFLKYASKLEKMSVISLSNEPTVQHMITEKLNMFPRSSTACVIKCR